MDLFSRAKPLKSRLFLVVGNLPYSHDSLPSNNIEFFKLLANMLNIIVGIC